ncbi:CHASE3 domain-containing protein [Streptomyces sp. MBT65]|uniref:sensor histidine kinase n=1 Tax=Streptomyces sp. MBT65 TaxID=1488395 RepID=UPI00190AAB07|nr:sensor histidine kinase [Streptomyces sp. MBT65]MBK3572418.1 CHASE3 domain-containing protein [Streptomyces sp. MBT65]
MAGGTGIGRRLTVQGWFFLALSLMVLLVVIGTAIGANLLSRTAAVTDDLLRRVQPAQTEAYRLQAALVNQETGVRGYAIAADRQFLTPYTSGKQDEARSAARLRAQLGDRPELLADLRAVERGAAAWRQNYAEPLAAAVTPGRPGAVDQTTVDSGKHEFDHLRGLWAKQNVDLAKAVKEGRTHLAHQRTVRNVVLSAMVAAFLLTGVVLAVLVRRLVTRPLEALTKASEQVAAGDFAHHIHGDGPADLTAVAGAVEGMRRRIVAELDASREQGEVLSRQAEELDAQAVELRRSNAELEQFAYVASHDLQEPLRKVASFCQLLEKRYGDKLDDRGLQYIDFAVDGAKRMQVLINDLLTFSRVGRLDDTRERVGLGPALDKALRNLATAVEESDARIDRPETLPEIVGDPTLLAMLWQNLVGNALKFRHSDRAPHVSVTCDPDPENPGMWRLSVTDNGIGIPEEFTDKVFVIFQRLHSRDAYGGTGIGLALCKKIVEHHGGRIWIDTEAVEGTRFCFTLPSAEDTTETTEGASDSEAPEATDDDKALT